MSVSVEMTAQELDAIKKLTKLDNDADAITKAAREFLRICRLRELKLVSGRVDFQSNWQELEQLEISEPDFPQ